LFVLAYIALRACAIPTYRVYRLYDTRSMQGMFRASVSELYLLTKSLINIGRAVDLCVITKKSYTACTGTESGLAMIYKLAAHRLVAHVKEDG